MTKFFKRKFKSIFWFLSAVSTILTATDITPTPTKEQTAKQLEQLLGKPPATKHHGQASPSNKLLHNGNSENRSTGKRGLERFANGTGSKPLFCKGTTGDRASLKRNPCRKKRP